MPLVRGYAAPSATKPLEPFQFERREPGDHDVVIDIAFSGICHSDVHQARDEWGGSAFPMVPGHEIAGHVTRVGAKVKRFKVGDAAGVGCFVDSCRECASCKEGLEQFCEKQTVFTYNAIEKDGKTRTYGGYSKQIVVDENYVLKIAAGQPLDRVAPLLCAGITTYSPLKEWKVAPGQRVGVMGLGGLGHMAIKLAVSMGADVTVFSTSPSKESDAKRLGAQHFAVATSPEAKALQGTMHLILNTVSAPIDLSHYLEFLRRDGTMVLLGVSPKPMAVESHTLVMKRRRLVGSLIGGIRQTQEMLDYCAQKGILPDIEVIPASAINTAYDRLVKGDVRYRFVIDASTF